MAHELLIHGGTVISPLAQTPIKADLLVEGGKIQQIGSVDTDGSALSKTIDAHGLFVAPGFIDLQINGSGGHDFLSASTHDIQQIVHFCHRHGTTGLLPTLISNPIPVLKRAMEIITKADLPSILGIHLEGPFISQKKRGTHNPAHILAPRLDAFYDLVNGYQKAIQIVSFAPEEPHALALLEAIKSFAVPAIAHSNATYAQAKRFVEQGGQLFTHVFNAMSGLHHRQPGAVGAALDSDVRVSVIADGVHIHPAVVRLIIKSKELKNICLVTDAISAAGKEDGTWSLGDVTLHVENGVARRDEQTLAGSLLTLDQALKNLTAFTSLSLPQAVRTATLNPATLLGLERHKGDLRPGYDADIVIFDQNFNVHYTVVMGKVVYTREAVTTP